MVVGCLRDTPAARSFDLLQRFQPRLMTIVNDQESFGFGDSVQLPQEG